MSHCTQMNKDTTTRTIIPWHATNSFNMLCTAHSHGPQQRQFSTNGNGHSSTNGEKPSTWTDKELRHQSVLKSVQEMATRWPMSTFFSVYFFLPSYSSTIEQNSMNKRRLHLYLYVYLLYYLESRRKNSLLVAATSGIKQIPTNPCIELIMDSATTTDI